MSISFLQKPLFLLALAGFLFNVTLFCHFSGTSDHPEMAKHSGQSTDIISDQNSPCCYSQTGQQTFLDKISTVQPTVQIFLAKILTGFILLAGLAFIIGLFDSRERSRYRYYKDKNLLSRLHNYILQFLSRGILQPQIYNA